MAAGERVLITFSRYWPTLLQDWHCSCWRWGRGAFPVFIRHLCTYPSRVLKNIPSDEPLFRSGPVPTQAMIGEARGFSAAAGTPFQRVGSQSGKSRGDIRRRSVDSFGTIPIFFSLNSQNCCFHLSPDLHVFRGLLGQIITSLSISRAQAYRQPQRFANAGTDLETTPQHPLRPAVLFSPQTPAPTVSKSIDNFAPLSRYTATRPALHAHLHRVPAPRQDAMARGRR